jgi:hypothetical protein
MFGRDKEEKGAVLIGGTGLSLEARVCLFSNWDLDDGIVGFDEFCAADETPEAEGTNEPDSGSGPTVNTGTCEDMS